MGRWNDDIMSFLKLNSYGDWLLVDHKYNSDPAKLQSALETLAKHDSVVLSEMHWLTTPGWDGISSATLRRLNPNIKVYGYYRCAKATFEGDWGKSEAEFAEIENMSFGCPIPFHEIEANDWWLRDGNGNKVTTKDGAYHYLDLGIKELQVAFSKRLLERIKLTGVDGVVLDYLPPRLSDPWLADGYFKGHPFPANYTKDTSWFNIAVRYFANRVFLPIRKLGYKIILPCIDYSSTDRADMFLRTVIDGTICEGFAWECGGKAYSAAMIARKMNDIENDPLITMICDAGTSFATGAEYESKQMFSLAVYYLAVPSNSDRHSYHHSAKGVVFWHPLWDFDIGEPVDLRVNYGTSAWIRYYSKGLVMANAAESPITIKFKGRYVGSDGDLYSGEVTLESHQGLILQSLNLWEWLKAWIRKYF